MQPGPPSSTARCAAHRGWRRALGVAALAAGVLALHGWGLHGLRLAAANAPAPQAAVLVVRQVAGPAAVVPPGITTLRGPAEGPPARPVDRVAAAQGQDVGAPAGPAPARRTGLAVAQPQVPLRREGVAGPGRIAAEGPGSATATVIEPAVPAEVGLPPALAPAAVVPSRLEAPLEAGIAGGAPAAPLPHDPADVLAVSSGAEAARAVPAPAAPLAEVYPTRVADPFTVRYRMKRGALAGEARLEWQHDGEHYQARLEAGVMLLGTVLAQHSRGGFDAAGLAPQRFTERRLRRAERAVNFARPAPGQRPRITFSARAGEAPWVAGVQDRLSWMMQLSAIAAGWPGRGPQVGDSISLHVAGPGGEVQHWVFSVAEVPAAAGGAQVPAGAAGTAIRLVREPAGTYDTAVQVWLDPQRHFQPRRVRMAEARGEPLELTRIEAETGP
jgi:hypothetical protein